jgi:sugar lactone lactonase YvrE
VETLAYGYGLVEGPRPAPDGSVYFSDVLGGGVHRWTPDGRVELAVPKRRGIGGIALHAAGGLVVSGRSVVHVRDGVSRTLLDAPPGVTGFNDLTVDAAGRVVVGALRFLPFAGESPVPGDFWLVEEAGSARMLFDGVAWPNGVGFSPDGRVLYASDYHAGHVLAYADGAHRVFWKSPSGEVDGLAVDAAGGVWVAIGRGAGVARVRPDGVLDHVLSVPAGFVASCAFGGADGRDLYIATQDNTEEPSRGGTLFRTRVDVPGAPVAAARI